MNLVAEISFSMVLHCIGLIRPKVVFTLFDRFFFSFDKNESSEVIDSVAILNGNAGLFGTEHFSVMATHKTI